MKKKMSKSTLFAERTLNILHIKSNKKNIELFTQIFKFIIVGGIATIIDFILIFIYREVFKLPVILSNTMAFVVATTYNFVASTRWVYNVKKDINKKKIFMVFVTFSSMGLVLSDTIIWITSDIFNIYYMLGKIIATCFVMIYNFITRKLFLE